MAQLSIVLPIYNVRDYLDRSLNSLLLQSFKDFEVLCVNDGSTDDSSTIIQKYVEMDSRFKRFDKKNGGLSDARNYGLERVNSPYIMFLDSDDYFEVEMLQLAMSRMIQDNLDLVVFDYQQIFDESNLNEQIHIPFESNKTYDPKIEKSLFAYINNAAWNKIYKTEIFKKNNIQYPYGYRHQDLGTTFRYLFYCQRVGFIDTPLYNYLADRPNNITQQVDQKIDHILDMVELNIMFFKENEIFEFYYEELKYLSIINILYSFRKLSKITNMKFVFSFIDRTFNLIKSNFKDFPKAKYAIWDEPNAEIYLSKFKLKVYYIYKSVRRMIWKKY